jgi:amino acid transporter
MEATMSVETDVPGQPGQAGGDKGLKKGALGLLSSVVIGVSSTAPGYSLAATLGFVIALVGLQAPVIMIMAFVPMFFIAYAYRELNRVAPDCGTTFTWATKAFGPYTGWMGGWGIVAADVIVMASLAQIAGIYGFLMFGAEGLADSIFWTTLVGCLWIAVLTYVCYRGIEISARLQFVFLAIEVVILVLFATVALFKVYAGTAPEGSVKPALSWFNPFDISSFDGSQSVISAFSASILLSVFIYWGWDSAVSVNEETSNPETTPGKAAVLSTVILLITYAIVATATLAFAGPDALADSDDVFVSVGSAALGSNVDKLLIFAVLTSAAASTQTTILPTARTTLSMAAYQALPARFSKVHPRFFTPTTSTIAMGGVSIAFYVILAAISDNILGDSASAVGLLIAFYYGLTGFAAAWYFRNDRGHGFRELAARVLMPLAGGIILAIAFVKTLMDDANPDNSDTQISIFGWSTGGIFVIAVGSLVLGIILMLVWKWRSPAFFTGSVLNRDTPINVVEGGTERPARSPLPTACRAHARPGA